MNKYNHAVDIGFSILSQQDSGEDITAPMIRESLLKRLFSLDSDTEIREATGEPFDTYEVDTDEPDPHPYNSDDVIQLVTYQNAEGKVVNEAVPGRGKWDSWDKVLDRLKSAGVDDVDYMKLLSVQPLSEVFPRTA